MSGESPSDGDVAPAPIDRCRQLETALVGPESAPVLDDPIASERVMVEALERFGDAFVYAYFDVASGALAESPEASFRTVSEGLDDATAGECDFPGGSAILLIAAAPTVRQFCEPDGANDCAPRYPHPTELPCFADEPTDDGVHVRYYESFVCDTNEEPAWDVDAGRWVAAQPAAEPEKFTTVDEAIG
ncbi:MAG: hypothetical protein AAF548_02510 [Actinomycetota bacterium]